MSAWGEMRRRSAGKLTRKEDKIADLEKAGVYKKIIEEHYPSETWKGLYSMNPIYIDEENKRDLIKEMDDFRWDGNRHSRIGDYYVIDYLSKL